MNTQIKIFAPMPARREFSGAALVFALTLFGTMFGFFDALHA